MNKDKLAEMMRRKNQLAAKVKALQESKANKSGLAYLIESELEKAEVLLAAKAVVEKLQKMAEDLAKVNGDDIMPLMEPLKSAFGPQMADAFQATVSQHINETTVAVTSAKDAISAEVAKFEGVINGSSGDMSAVDTVPGNDMATAGAPAPTAAAPGALPGADATDMGDDEMGADAGVSTLDQSDPFAADADTAAGRAKKESAAPKGKMVESKAQRIVKAHKALISEGENPVTASVTVAKQFGVDFGVVVKLVRESKYTRNVQEGMWDDGDVGGGGYSGPTSKTWSGSQSNGGAGMGLYGGQSSAGGGSDTSSSGNFQGMADNSQNSYGGSASSYQNTPGQGGLEEDDGSDINGLPDTNSGDMNGASAPQNGSGTDSGSGMAQTTTDNDASDPTADTTPGSNSPSDSGGMTTNIQGTSGIAGVDESFILKAFRAQIREGVKPVAAAQALAKRYNIDFRDVVEVIRESKKETTARVGK